MEKLTLLLVGAVSWIVMAGGALWLFGVWPHTPLAWLLVLGFGPLLFALVTGLAEMLGATVAKLPGIRHADSAVEHRTANETLSTRRVGYYLLRLLVLVPPLVLIWWWVEDKAAALPPEALREWWHHHFR